MHRREAIPHKRFRLIPFRSPLLRESHSLSSPPLTEMFQFGGLPLPALYIQARVTRHNSRWVSPFGYFRVTACKRLSETFRCLLRPSSAPSAKASTVRPLQLDYAKILHSPMFSHQSVIFILGEICFCFLKFLYAVFKVLSPTITVLCSFVISG